MALKVVVLALAVAFIAAPVAYGAYVINAMAAPGEDWWRWPVFATLGLIAAALSWWAVVSIHKKFPYS